MQTRKIDDIKKLYLENCIRENNYPHQEIISKLRLAEADPSLLEHIQLDASDLKGSDLTPLVDAIKTIGSVKTLSFVNLSAKDPQTVSDILQVTEKLDKVYRDVADSSNVRFVRFENPSFDSKNQHLKADGSVILREAARLDTIKENELKRTPVEKGKTHLRKPERPKENRSPELFATRRKYSEPVLQRTERTPINNNPREFISNYLDTMRREIDSSIKSILAVKSHRKVMSRVEWIAQIRGIFCRLIHTYNQDTFAKETVVAAIHAAKSELPLLNEDEYQNTHLDNGYSLQDILKVLNQAEVDPLNYDDAIDIISSISKKDISIFSIGLPKPKLPELPDEECHTLSTKKKIGSTDEPRNQKKKMSPLSESKPNRDSKYSSKLENAEDEDPHSREIANSKRSFGASLKIDEDDTANDPKLKKKLTDFVTKLSFGNLTERNLFQTHSSIQDIMARAETARFCSQQTLVSNHESKKSSNQSSNIIHSTTSLNNSLKSSNNYFGVDNKPRTSTKATSPLKGFYNGEDTAISDIPQARVSSETTVSDKKQSIKQQSSANSTLHNNQTSIAQKNSVETQTSPLKNHSDRPVAQDQIQQTDEINDNSDEFQRETHASNETVISPMRFESDCTGNQTIRLKSSPDKSSAMASTNLHHLSPNSIPLIPLSLRKNPSEVGIHADQMGNEETTQRERLEQFYRSSSYADGLTTARQLHAEDTARTIFSKTDKPEIENANMLIAENMTARNITERDANFPREPSEVLEEVNEIGRREEIISLRNHQISDERKHSSESVERQTLERDNLEWERQVSERSSKRNTNKDAGECRQQNQNFSTQPSKLFMGSITSQLKKKQKLSFTIHKVSEDNDGKSVMKTTELKNTAPSTRAMSVVSIGSENLNTRRNSKLQSYYAANIILEDEPHETSRSEKNLINPGQSTTPKALETVTISPFSFLDSKRQPKSEKQKYQLVPSKSSIQQKPLSNKWQDFTKGGRYSKKAVKPLVVDKMELMFQKLDQASAVSDKSTLPQKIRQNYKVITPKPDYSCKSLSLHYVNDPELENEAQFQIISEICHEIQALKLTDSWISYRTLPRLLHSNLLILNLSNNNLTSCSFLTGLSNLIFLNISNNELEELEAMSGCWNLEEVIFSHNNISRIPSLARAQALTVIDASFNQIYSYENIASLAQNNNLKILNLFHTPIIKKPQSKTALQNLLPRVLTFEVFHFGLSDFKHLKEICFNELQNGLKPEDSYQYFPNRTNSVQENSTQFFEKLCMGSRKLSLHNNFREDYSRSAVCSPKQLKTVAVESMFKTSAKKKPKVKKTQPIVSPYKAMSLGSPKNPKKQQKELINQKNIQSMQSSSLTPKNLHKQKEGLASKSSTPQKVMEVLKKK